MEEDIKKFDPKLITLPGNSEVVEALESLLEKAKSGNCEGMAMVFLERGSKGCAHLIQTFETAKSCYIMVGALFDLIQRLTK